MKDKICVNCGKTKEKHTSKIKNGYLSSFCDYDLNKKFRVKK